MILLNTPYTENIKTAISQCEHFVTLGELKRGVDPAGAMSVGKPQKRRLIELKMRLMNLPALKGGVLDPTANKNGVAPSLFFVGAAIENKMAGEIFNKSKSKYINNAANLTKPEHTTALSDWRIHL